MWMIKGRNVMFKYPCEVRLFAHMLGYSVFDERESKSENWIRFEQLTPYGTVHMDAHLVDDNDFFFRLRKE